MDNGQMPPVQNTIDSPVSQTASGRPMIQQVQAAPAKKKEIVGLIKTIVIIVVSLIAVTFIGLFIWMFTQYNEARSDIDGQILVATAAARDEQASKDEAEFLEREKYPYKTFLGPVDYGELSFEYPKTWSVYISRDAANGGDFEAYFNPVQIEPISNTTVNALRVQVLDADFESVVSRYQGALENRERPLTMGTISVNGTTANLYTGIIPGTELSGAILVLKIRDKTVVMRTDSTLFRADFDKLIETIKFNA